jgi:hypothetical protein
MFQLGRLMFKEAVNEIRVTYDMSNGNDDFFPSQFPYWCFWKKPNASIHAYQLFIYEVLQILLANGSSINYETKRLKEMEVTLSTLVYIFFSYYQFYYYRSLYAMN